MTLRRFSTALLTAFVAAAAAIMLTLLGASSAHAHASLVSATPEDGESTESAPTEIVLEFNENMQEIGNEVAVTDPDGTNVADGELSVDGTTISQPIAADAAGTYTVSWRAVSADGHPISGEYTFEVQQSAEPSDVEDESTQAEPETTEDETDEVEAAEDESTATEETTAADSETEESNSSLIIPIVVALGAVVVVILTVRRHRAR